MTVATEHSPDSAAMLVRFGRDGMSSDESSEDEDETKYYRILDKPWRSVAAGMWIRSFDDEGRSQRIRVVSGGVGSTNAVRGLPLGAYRDGWLEGLSEYTKSELSVDMGKYESFWGR